MMQRKFIKRASIFFITSVVLSAFILIVVVIRIEDFNIPKGTIRKGDLKEYYWLKKVSVSQNTMRICIYNDYNGKLALDADFPLAGFSDTTLNSVRIFEPCYLVLYNGKKIKPTKIYAGYLNE